MPKKKYSHVHQYERIYIQSNRVGITRLNGRGRAQWQCALPDCNHFIPGNVPEPYGKLSLCHSCMESFTLDVENMKLDKPICDKCVNPDGPRVYDPDDYERFEAKAFIAKKTGKEMDDITEEEITHAVELRRILMKSAL